MRRVGFVGNGSDKFTPQGEADARQFISDMLCMENADVMVSGHSPVGGIDIWAEEMAAPLGVTLDLKVPEINQWDPPGGYGFKARNLDIAGDSDVLYVVLADVYPEEYRGRRWGFCYHCARQGEYPPHVKSGGCWTGWKAVALGKDVHWKIINN